MHYRFHTHYSADPGGGAPPVTDPPTDPPADPKPEEWTREKLLAAIKDPAAKRFIESSATAFDDFMAHRADPEKWVKAMQLKVKGCGEAKQYRQWLEKLGKTQEEIEGILSGKITTPEDQQLKADLDKARQSEQSALSQLKALEQQLEIYREVAELQGLDRDGQTILNALVDGRLKAGTDDDEPPSIKELVGSIWTANKTRLLPPEVIPPPSTPPPVVPALRPQPAPPVSGPNTNGPIAGPLLKRL